MDEKERNQSSHNNIGCAIAFFLCLGFAVLLIMLLVITGHNQKPAKPSGYTPPRTTVTVPTPKPTSKPYSSGSSNTQSNRSDPYDVESYPDAEEFYYYNRDDFFDYYDAEDYYNDHQ